MDDVYTGALDYLLNIFPNREFWRKHSREYLIVVVSNGNGCARYFGPVYSSNGFKRIEKAIKSSPLDSCVSVEISEGVFDARKQRRKV